MPTTHTVATVVRGDERFDVAVPLGTTVSGVVSAFGTSIDRVPVTDELGRHLDAREAFGKSLGPGAVVVIGATANEEARAATQIRAERVPFPTAAVTALGVLVSLSPVVALLPAFGLWVRVLLAVVLTAAAVRLLAPPANRPRWQLLLAPAVAAAAVAAVVPHPDLIAPWSYALVFTWSGLAVAMLARVLVRDEFVEVAAIAWLLPALTISIVSFSRLAPEIAAPLVLTASIALLGFAPTNAVRVPESQLLHLPMVLNTALSVHTPEVTEPAPVTPRRVRHTMRLGVALHSSFIALACLGVLTSAGAVSGMLAAGTLESWGALALLGLAVLQFSLQPRGAHSSFARWAPRMVVVVLIAVLALAAPFGATWWWFAAIVAGAATLIGFGVWAQRTMYAPLLTRLADVAERISLALALPALLVAAGFFSAVRSWS